MHSGRLPCIKNSEEYQLGQEHYLTRVSLEHLEVFTQLKFNHVDHRHCAHNIWSC